MDCVYMRVVRPNSSVDDECAVISIATDASFSVYLDLLTRECMQQIQSFSYLEEDNDTIAVKDDNDLQHFLNYYCLMQSQVVTSYPITVIPITKKRMNTLGLRVEVNTSGVEQASASELSPRLSSRDFSPSSQSEINDSQIKYLELAGHGNGGSVYRAVHEPTRTIMAVKVIPLDATPEMQKKIMTELAILHQCRSAFIIGYYGAFFSDGRIKICTEYMDGGSLEKFGRIPERILGAIVVSVLQGLQYLWSLKVMHRDIKPSNILVNSEGFIKLCDFGVSAQLVESVTKTYVGTNAYMAPERILAQSYSVKSDVWSLGLSIMELALGRFPYPNDGTEGERRQDLRPIELLQCIAYQPPPSLPSSRFSPEFVDFINCCLVHNPDDRPTPIDMLGHPFVTMHAHTPASEVKDWVLQQIAQFHRVIPHSA